MLETVAAVVMMSLLMIVVGRLSISTTDNTAEIDAQYSLLAADAYMSDIYDDFHKAVGYDFSQSPGGIWTLTFTKEDGTASIYSFDNIEGMCYKDGIPQFAAQRFAVVGAYNNIAVTLKLDNERILELVLYR